MKITPKITAVLLFNLAYIVPALVSAASRANYEFILYIGVVITAVTLVMWFFARYGLGLGLLWCLSFWGMLHMAGGLVVVPDAWPTQGSKVLYNLWLIGRVYKFDQFVHAYGFGTTTWLVWQILQRTLSRKFERPLETIIPTGGLLFLCVCASMGLGAVNEIVEFLAMVLFPETNVGGYVNTALDLVANLSGAVVAACWIFFARKK